METVKIVPNPAKTMESMRHLNYSNVTAIADIVDNSIDAGATNVDIRIGDDFVAIADNGCGMDKETLIQAITMGSDTTKEDWQLGRFGMGLVTAGISLSPYIRVSTTQDGKTYNAVLDLEHISKNNQWEAFCEEGAYTDAPREQGTVVWLERIDNFNFNSAEIVAKKVAAHLSEVFRKFIQAGVEICVNGNKLTPLDPLALDSPNTEVLIDQEVITKSGKSFHVTLVELEKEASETNAEMKVAPRNQGFYIVRNNRQIGRALMFEGIKGLVRHPSLNKMRCEISYMSELDDDFGINFTKDQVVLKQSLSDKIAEVVTGPINLIRHRYNSRTADETANLEMDHSDAEEIIRRKRTLLPNPQGWKEKRAKRQKTEEEVDTKPKDIHDKPVRTREHAKQTQLGYKGMGVKFSQANLSPSAPLYDYDFEGSTILIRWNTAHPFYQKFVAPYNNEKNVASPVDLLVFSLVNSEINTAETDDQRQKLLQFREDMSRVLRTLMA